MPDVLHGDGMNVVATDPYILADDFLCTMTGPITAVHIWGSWLDDQRDPSVQFKLSFHSDVPAGVDVDTPWSHPGPELWSMFFNPAQYQVRSWFFENQRFYDPFFGVVGSDTRIWQYNFFIPEVLAFHQQFGNIYWLDVQAFSDGDLFGWTTSYDHFNDNAVFGDGSFWEPMHDPDYDPDGTKPLDMAFVLETVPEPGSSLLACLGGRTVLAAKTATPGQAPLSKGACTKNKRSLSRSSFVPRHW